MAHNLRSRSKMAEESMTNEKQTEYSAGIDIGSTTLKEEEYLVSFYKDN